MDTQPAPAPQPDRHDLRREAVSSVALIGCVVFLLLLATSALSRI
jgi:hypothetical protein